MVYFNCPALSPKRDSYAFGTEEITSRRPITVNGTVPPRLTPYSKRRQREYLTVKEVERLIGAARERVRYGHRDSTMILVAYRDTRALQKISGFRRFKPLAYAGR
jgi:hypothetical protein